ncbi:ADP-ribosylglycohydrolase family protein [Kineococcus sp. NPDC059986]|uniref:ADP-ribosylglycohydrolase family protein n=1 Tax=Kineococcus sp. NPDC059986 TaxID=3155538 RepID=UPI00344BF2C0
MSTGVPSPARSPLRARRVRGLLHGLAVGEVLESTCGSAGVVQHGVATQLACFTAAAGIRTSLRVGRGTSADPRADLLDAYRRWAQVRHGARVPSPRTAWLDDVPLLTRAAGDPRDTVRALVAGGAGTRRDPVSTADGWHALARALPLAAHVVRDPQAAVTAAVDSVALTHGPRAFAPTAVAVLLAAAAFRTGDPVEAVAVGLRDAVLLGVDFAAVAVVDDAVRAAREAPASTVVLRGGAADGSAAAALWGATYCVLSHPTTVDAGLALARTAPHPDAVGAVTGALLGAAHGADALPQSVLTRIDLAYVIDRLARDLAVVDGLGVDGADGADAGWRERYGLA